jgi:splicing factor 45
MPAVSSSASTTTSSDPAPAPASKAEQHGIDWYRSTADDDAAILEERRQRQYDEAQKKKQMKKFQKQFGYWNPTAPHKPERWSNLKAYRASGGYRRKQEGFNDFLRSAARQSERSREESEGSNASRPISSSGSTSPPLLFAQKPSFAPPPSYDLPSASSGQDDEDPYTRRMRLSQQHSNGAPPPPPEPQSRSLPPPPTVSDDLPPPPPPPAPTAGAPGITASSSIYDNATISAPPVRYANATISAPPVRYEQPPSQHSTEEPEYSERPAKRPKISKAEAMMAKMGYVKGQGLGKNNDGVTTHLEVKIRKPVPGGKSSMFDDGEGNKVKSAQVWDVRGGERKKDEPGKFGEESPVVVTWGCVDGVDWSKNAERDDGGIRQDMGEVFSTKVCIMARRACENALTIFQFGPVERLQVDESNAEGVVYIHFKSVLSALNVGLGHHTRSTSTNSSFRPSIVSTKDSNTKAGTSAHATTTNASSMLAFTTIDGRSSMNQLDVYGYHACVEAIGGND